MPGSKKRFALSTTIRWTTFEVEIFRYLALVSGRTMAENTRIAIRNYVKQLPEFSPEEFAEFLRKDCLAKMPKGEEREALAMELKGFIETSDKEKTPAFDRVAASNRKMNIKSSAADFKFD